MTGRHSRKETEMDPRGVDIHFPPEVQRAFADLAAAVQSSPQFDPETLKTVQEWGSGKPSSVYDILTAFPLVAEETFKHIHATGDERAADAWGQIGSDLLEKGFTLDKQRRREK
jgi:hypothetical protein